MHSIIVGTAGHIDHGKTALVHALTGVNADRLPEEKRRGITIDLGFAELELPDIRVGFVDVPGHERFVKNMLAGAHGIDLVALVIAADEGVMPQTREHFDICRLLQTKSGLIIITKSDKVDEELLALVRAEAEELVDGSFLEAAPIVAVSSRTGAGIDELKKTLRDLALAVPARSSETIARLPIDRVFSLRGFGAVVTGTLIAGSISEGDEMELLPGNVRARVRGLQVHGKEVKHAIAGQRTAVNLGGIDTAAIERGMTLAPAGRLRSTQIMDVRVDVLATAPRPFRSRQRVRVHLGTAEVLARMQVIESSGEIAPGTSGFVQLRMESPVVAIAGERFIVRSYSPSRTIGGGEVIDAFAKKRRGREAAAAYKRLAALLTADNPTKLALFAETAGSAGLHRSDIAARMGWTDEILNDAVREAVSLGSIVEAEGVYLGREAFDELSDAAREAVAEHHKNEPLSRGLPRETLRERFFAGTAPGVFRSVIAHLEATGVLVAEKEIVREASHSLNLSSVDAELKDGLEAAYKNAALEAPTFDEARARAGKESIAADHTRAILQLLIDAGTLVRVSNDYFFHREAIDGLLSQLREYGAGHEPERLIDVAAFKQMAGISRKFAIPLLEYMDREHITRRVGDKRKIL